MTYRYAGRVILVWALLMSGCTAAGKGATRRKPPAQKVSLAGQDVKALSPGIQVIEPATLLDEGALAVKGMVFARTIFEGIVKTSLVQLTLIREGQASKSYPLILGEKAKQGNFPWEIKAVESGFFVIQLPAGAYRITSVSIPVGTTLATEDIDISFNVTPDVVNYIGTLKILGTKEKLKLGGVPVVKPGFEYTAQVLDEREAAFEEFLARFPDYDGKIIAQLMRLGPRVPAETNPSQDSPKEE